MNDKLIKFSKRLRDERKFKGYTQRAMADELSISFTTYSHYECLGRESGRQPSLETLIKICEILQIKSDYLLGLED